MLVVELRSAARKVSGPAKPVETMLMASVPELPEAMVSVAGRLLMLMPPVLLVAVVDTVIVSVLEAAMLLLSPE